MKESQEAMSQQQPPTPHQPPSRGYTFLWFGVMLLLTTCCLYIYASVAKQDFIISVITPILTILVLFFSILSYKPNILPQLQQSIKIGLLVSLVFLLVGSLTMNAYLLIRFQILPTPNVGASSTSVPTPTMTPGRAHLTPTPTWT